jgi:predicted small metal-binding protein
LIQKVAEHVRKVHKVQTPTDTIVNFVKTKIRR